jgi:hypothetical protein
MKELEGWVFNYNAFNGQWAAARREDYALLFNEYRNPNVLRSKSFETLQELIIKTNGDIDKIKKLTN